MSSQDLYNPSLIPSPTQAQLRRKSPLREAGRVEASVLLESLRRDWPVVCVLLRKGRGCTHLRSRARSTLAPTGAGLCGASRPTGQVYKQHHTPEGQ